MFILTEKLKTFHRIVVCLLVQYSYLYGHLSEDKYSKVKTSQYVLALLSLSSLRYSYR